MAYEDDFEKSDSKVYKVSNLKRYPMRYIREVSDILRHGDYDGVYVNMLSAANTLPLKLAKRCGVPMIIAHAHNDHVPAGALRKFLHSRNVDTISQYANAYFACSAAAGEWLFPNVPSENIVLVPNAIPTDDFLFDYGVHTQTRERHGVSRDAFLLGHVGRFQEQKNHEFIVRLFGRYHRINPHAKLMLVGEGELRGRIRERIRSEGVQDDVFFINPTEAIGQYYIAFDCFLFPSLFEGLGIAGLEAQAAGLPVIASDTLPKELNVSGAVKYLSLSDEEAWLNQLGIIYDQMQLSGNVAQHRIAQGRQFDKTKFSLSQSGSCLADTIVDIARRNGVC